jgi:hypothetical protein
MIASQFRYGLDFLAAAVRAKVRMKSPANKAPRSWRIKSEPTALSARTSRSTPRSSLEARPSSSASAVATAWPNHYRLLSQKSALGLLEVRSG